MTVTEIQHHTETLPTKTVTVPAPANTRKVASPAPQFVSPSSSTTQIPRTTAYEVVEEQQVVVEAPSPIEVLVEEEEEYEEEPLRTVRVKGGRRRQPGGWFSW